MGIKLDWDSQTSQNLDAIEIYRGSSPINRDSPGAPLVTLPGDATSYEDKTVKNKNLYYYRIASKKGTERGWGENKQVGYFSETGPGRSVPLRGDWNSGWMDMVLAADFIDTANLVSKIPGYVFGTSGVSSWYKLCYKGKVLFIPTTAIFNLSYNDAYSIGILFGEDGVGQLPTGPAGAVNQRCVVNIAGLEYLVRMPRLTDFPTTQYLTTAAQYASGEYHDIIRRIASSVVDNASGQKSKLYDAVALPGYTMGPHRSVASNTTLTYPNQPANTVAVTLTSKQSVYPILELIMP